MVVQKVGSFTQNESESPKSSKNVNTFPIEHWRQYSLTNFADGFLIFEITVENIH